MPCEQQAAGYDVTIMESYRRGGCEVLLAPPPTTKDVIYKRYGETDRRVFTQGGASKFIIIMPDANIRARV